MAFRHSQALVIRAKRPPGDGTFLIPDCHRLKKPEFATLTPSPVAFGAAGVWKVEVWEGITATAALSTASLSWEWIIPIWP